MKILFLSLYSCVVSFDTDVLSLTVKFDNKEKQEKVDITTSNTAKTNTSEKKPLKQDNGPEKKSDKIIKDEDKVEINSEKNKAKSDNMDKQEKTNKDQGKGEENKKEEKGGKGPSKSPTGDASKSLPGPDSKSKASYVHTHIHPCTEDYHRRKKLTSPLPQPSQLTYWP